MIILQCLKKRFELGIKGGQALVGIIINKEIVYLDLIAFKETTILVVFCKSKKGNIRTSFHIKVN